MSRFLQSYRAKTAPLNGSQVKRMLERFGLKLLSWRYNLKAYKSIYKANKNKTTFFGLMFGYFIILVSIVPAILFLPEKDLKGLSTLTIPLIFCIFFTYVLVSSTLKVLIKYELDSMGIKIIKPLARTHKFDWIDIESVNYLNAESTQEILSDCVKSQFQLREDQDVGGYIRLLRSKSPMYKYFTLVSEAKIRTSGETGHLYSLDLKKQEGMVLLKLMQGNIYYLTPTDPEKFAIECNDLKNYK